MTRPETTLLECEYFPCIAWYQHFLRGGDILVELYEHFERTTFRNRCEVTGPNGKITLSVPLERGRNQRTIMKDLKICRKEPWQKLHWKTLCASYRRAPYFEYYEEEMKKCFEKEFDFLTDLNLYTLEVLNTLLKVNKPSRLTTNYEKNYDEVSIDARRMFKPGNNDGSGLPVYMQNFEERHGFIPNLSMLDMLFSCGPRAVELLK